MRSRPMGRILQPYIVSRQLPLAARTASGLFPYGGLVLSGNNLYGTAEDGGIDRNGSVFAITTNSVNGSGFRLVYTLTGGTADGGFPTAGLVVSGGVLYGTATIGGLRMTALHLPSKPMAPFYRYCIHLPAEATAAARRAGWYCPATLFMARRRQVAVPGLVMAPCSRLTPAT